MECSCTYLGAPISLSLKVSKIARYAGIPVPAGCDLENKGGRTGRVSHSNGVVVTKAPLNFF